MPAEAALVIGPGTAPTARPASRRAPAVFSEPLRQPASTTTVAEVSAAMSRFRCRNRHLVGAEPQGTSLDHRARLGDAADELGVADRVRPIGAAREEGDSEPADRERGAVRRTVDAVRAAGDDRDAGAGEVGRQLQRDVVAVRGRGTGADDRDGRIQPPQSRGVAAHPQAQRRVLGEIVELPRPFRVGAGHDPHASARGDSAGTSRSPPGSAGASTACDPSRARPA